MTHYDDCSSSQPAWSVTYTYDYLDRRIRKTVDSNGDGTIDEYSYQVHRGDELALEFTDDDGLEGQTHDTDQAHRYLYGPAVDQILADEQSGGEVLWGLADHQGTIRDVVDSSANLELHRVYNAFGNVTDQTGTADFLFAFTGRPFDLETGLYDYRARWYDPEVGRFLSEDPAGLGADANLYRYAGNSPVINVDPSGLCTSGFMAGAAASASGFLGAGSIGAAVGAATTGAASRVAASGPVGRAAFVAGQALVQAAGTVSQWIVGVLGRPTTAGNDAEGYVGTIFAPRFAPEYLGPNGEVWGSDINRAIGEAYRSQFGHLTVADLRELWEARAGHRRQLIKGSFSSAEEADQYSQWESDDYNRLIVPGSPPSQIVEEALWGPDLEPRWDKWFYDFLERKEDRSRSLGGSRIPAELVGVGLGLRGMGGPLYPPGPSSWFGSARGGNSALLAGRTSTGSVAPSKTGSPTPRSEWLRGRYTHAASKPNAYWQSGRRVFPTRRNSGLSGARLRAEQGDFFAKGLRKGKSVALLRGQASEAGYKRVFDWRAQGDYLADRGAENALQQAIQDVAVEGIEVW